VHRPPDAEPLAGGRFHYPPCVDLLHPLRTQLLQASNLGLDVIPGTPAEFAAAIEREIPRWAAVIKHFGIKATE